MCHCSGEQKAWEAGEERLSFEVCESCGEKFPHDQMIDDSCEDCWLG